MNARRQLAGLLVVGLLLRVLWWGLNIRVIESEGVEYARIAQTWFGGMGYRGILDGIEVMFPPGYPLLIGLVGMAVPDLELAARLVSLLAGLLLIACTFWLTRRVAGPRAGLLAGLLAATNPLLIALSIGTYVEGIAATCVLLSVTCALCAAGGTKRSLFWAAGAGAAVGYAYLCRPELVLVLLPVTVYLGVVMRRRRGPAAAALCVLGCLLVATPQVARLSSLSGSFRWEGKTGANEVINARMAKGLSYEQAARGLDVTDDFGKSAPYLGGPDLAREQVAYLVATKQHAAKGGADLMRDVVRRVPGVLGFWWWSIRQWTSIWKVPVGVLALLVGLASSLRPSRRRPGLLLLGAVFALHGAFPLGVRFLWSRYAFPLIPLCVPYMAIGSLVLGDELFARLPQLSRRLTPRIWLPVCLGLSLLIAVSAYRKVIIIDEFSQSLQAEVKLAGRDLARRFRDSGGQGRPHVMGYHAPLAHYANARLSYLPNTTDERAALRYVHWKQPDFIALHASDLPGESAYVRAWLESGPPDTCAELVSSEHGVGGEVKVWRWRCKQPGAAHPF